MTGCKNIQEINDKINSIPNADIYGISCFSTNYNFVKKIIKKIRVDNSNSYVVLGGPHPSAMPLETLEDAKCDAVIVGEGEDAFTNLVKDYQKNIIKKGIFIGLGRDDIDSYPFPSRDLIDISSYSRKLLGNPLIVMLSSRGCKNHCLYCNSVVMGGGNRNVRYRSSDNIVKEIFELIIKGYKNFRFNDDHFTGNPNLKELLIQLKKLNIQFRIFAKVEDLTEEICKLLKEAGCVHIAIGLESLNPANLKIIGKANQIGKETNVNIAKQNGLIVRSSFMVGLPYDNDETIAYYFTKASEIGLDEFSVYPLIPYPGTAIWKYPEKLGYKIVNKNYSEYIQLGRNQKTCFSLMHKNFTQEDVKRWYNLAHEILKNAGVKHMSDSEIAR